MIIEGLLATQTEDGQPHLAVMGAAVDDSWTRFELRPFCETQSFQNLQRSGAAVFHTTDEVDLIVALIVGARPALDWQPARHIACSIYRGACRYFELSVVYAEQHPPRGSFQCRVIGHGELRPATGFNRARHLVLEAAILATRAAFLPAEELAEKYAWFEPIVRKTGSAVEIEAFDRLRAFVHRSG